ncbi:MAG: TlpA family protein disulfide reductase [Bacteroidota bacterium]|nr:TlpA family protein disulfide reductase [Bacteroidota bacterium]
MRLHLFILFFLPLTILKAQTISVKPDRDVADKRNFGIKINWIKGKDVILGNDSLCVVFFDVDVNGCFTSLKDKIALLPYGIDSAYCYDYMGVRQIQQGLILGFSGKAYEINTDTNGCNPVIIKRRADLQPPIYLQLGDQLPHFKFQVFNGDSVDVYSMMQPGKFTYIEFWGMWCLGCVQSIPKIKTLQETKSDSLVIISLDAYDDRQKVITYVKEKNMTWIQGYSNTVIEKLLYAGDGFPYGVLVDTQGRIIAFDVRPSQVSHTMQ